MSISKRYTVIFRREGTPEKFKALTERYRVEGFKTGQGTLIECLIHALHDNVNPSKLKDEIKEQVFDAFIKKSGRVHMQRNLIDKIDTLDARTLKEIEKLIKKHNER